MKPPTKPDSPICASSELNTLFSLMPESLKRHALKENYADGNGSLPFAGRYVTVKYRRQKNWNLGLKQKAQKHSGVLAATATQTA